MTYPNEIRIPVFVRELDGELHLVARVPLLLLLSLNVPKWGAGYLDFERADPVLRRAGEVFASEAPLFHPDGSPLPPTLRAYRVALPWDRSFTSFDAARETVLSDPLPADTQVFWNQGFLDFYLTYPAPADGSAEIGMQRGARLRRPGGAGRALRAPGSERRGVEEQPLPHQRPGGQGWRSTRRPSRRSSPSAGRGSSTS